LGAVKGSVLAFPPLLFFEVIMTDNSTVIINEVNTANIFGQPHNVILFNDDHNDMYSVSAQIIKATQCTPERAIAIMYEAHTKGSAVAFTGSKERCEHVESILAGPPTRLATAIEPA
jgi:ATP-dependent Clp protease adapter protein ClpS